MLSFHKEQRFFKIAIFFVFIAVSLVYKIPEIKADVFHAHAYGVQTWLDGQSLLNPFPVKIIVYINGAWAYESAPLTGQNQDLDLIFPASCDDLIKVDVAVNWKTDISWTEFTSLTTGLWYPDGTHISPLCPRGCASWVRPPPINLLFSPGNVPWGTEKDQEPYATLPYGYKTPRQMGLCPYGCKMSGSSGICTTAANGGTLGSCTGPGDNADCTYGCNASTQQCILHGLNGPCDPSKGNDDCTYGCDTYNQTCILGGTGGGCSGPSDNTHCVYGCKASTHQCVLHGQDGWCDISEGDADCNYECTGDGQTSTCTPIQDIVDPVPPNYGVRQHVPCNGPNDNASCNYGCDIASGACTRGGQDGACNEKMNFYDWARDILSPELNNSCMFGCTNYWPPNIPDGSTGGGADLSGACVLGGDPLSPIPASCPSPDCSFHCIIDENGVARTCGKREVSAGDTVGGPCSSFKDCEPECNGPNIDCNSGPIGWDTYLNQNWCTGGRGPGAQCVIGGGGQTCSRDSQCDTSSPLCIGPDCCPGGSNCCPGDCNNCPSGPDCLHHGECRSNSCTQVYGTGGADNCPNGCKPTCIGQICMQNGTGPAGGTPCPKGTSDCIPGCLNGTCILGGGGRACTIDNNSTCWGCKGEACVPDGTPNTCSGPNDSDKCKYSCVKNQCVQGGGGTISCGGPDDATSCTYGCNSDHQCVLSGTGSTTSCDPAKGSDDCSNPAICGSSAKVYDTTDNSYTFKSTTNAWIPNSGDGNVTRLDSETGFAPMSPYYVDSQPFGAAVDSFNNAWITNFGGSTIAKIDPSITNQDSVTIYPYPVIDPNADPMAVTHPTGVAVDVYNDIWVVNFGQDNVQEFNGTTGQPMGLPYPVGFRPYGIAIDAHNNIWVVNRGDDINPGTVTELHGDNNDGGKSGQVGSLIGTYQVGLTPQGIAVDPSGNVWVSNWGESSVSMINPADTCRSTDTSTCNSNANGKIACSNNLCITTFPVGQGPAPAEPYGIAIDPSGNVWVALYGQYKVEELDGTTGAKKLLKSYTGANSGPYGVAVDGAGNVWVVNDHHTGYPSGTFNGSSTSATRCDPATGQCVAAAGNGDDSGCVITTTSVASGNSPNGNLTCSFQDAGNVTEIDSATGNKIGSYPVGITPYALGDFTGYASQHFLADFCQVGTPVYPSSVIPFPSSSNGYSVTWQCVNGGESVDCSASKPFSSCGDGILDPGETCDMGTSPGTPCPDDGTCQSDCTCITPPQKWCGCSGNNKVCDAGEDQSNDSCTDASTCPDCGSDDGVCGTAAQPYSINDTQYVAPFCKAGKLYYEENLVSSDAIPSDVIHFPSAFSTPIPYQESWECRGSTKNDPCTATVPEDTSCIPGVCGSANGKTYPHNTTAWPPGDTFCLTENISYKGTPVVPPAKIHFPDADSIPTPYSETWTCVGINGGGNATCQASRY